MTGVPLAESLSLREDNPEQILIEPGECGTVSGGNSFQLKPVRAESINGLSGWHELPPDCRKMEQAGEIY